jgi:hypothetical protein
MNCYNFVKADKHNGDIKVLKKNLEMVTNVKNYIFSSKWSQQRRP